MIKKGKTGDTAMFTQLIIAYGNPLHGDDGLGWHAARRLEKESLPPSTGIETHHKLLADLAYPLSCCQTAVFVAAARGGEIGAVLSRPLRPKPADAVADTPLTPEALLAHTLNLYGQCPRAFHVAIVGRAFGLCDRVSHQVSAALPQLTDRVRMLLSAAPVLVA
jgi:hydrogenase maturation protease